MAGSVSDSQADSAGSIPVTRSTREKRCSTSESGANPTPWKQPPIHAISLTNDRLTIVTPEPVHPRAPDPGPRHDFQPATGCPER